MRIASLCYATEQGLGRLMKSFFDAGLVTDPIIFRHSERSRVTHHEWYPRSTLLVEPRTSIASNPAVEALLRRVQVLLCFETFFDWGLVTRCRDLGVKTVLVPMYEWTPKVWPAKPDAVLCPSLLDVDTFKDEFDPCPFLPIPVDPAKWQLRTRADRWLHNAGNVGCREHKGTRQLLEAVPLVRSPDFRLTVRGQDVSALTSITKDLWSGLCRDARINFQFGEIHYGELWDWHDVYIAPEKFNGLSLPLQEARAAGLLVVTTDRYPANTWLPTEPLIPVERTERACVSRNYREFDEAVVTPQAIAGAIDRLIGTDIGRYSEDGRAWAEAHSWAALLPRYRAELQRIVEAG